MAVVGSNLQQVKRLLLDAAGVVEIRPYAAKIPSLGFLFTGQGTQQTAMARELYESVASFRADIISFNGIGRSHHLPSFLPLVTGLEDINALSPIVIQLGTVTIQIALARLWQNWGLVPQYVLGHSLGEFAALCIAGVLSISDTIYLTGSRALLLEKKCIAGSYGMLAVKASAAEINQILGEVSVEVACLMAHKILCSVEPILRCNG